MHALLRDLRYAIRSLANDRAFAAIAVLTLSLGIGATTSIFSVVNAVVMQPLPYPDAHQLMHLRTEMVDGRETTGGMSDFGLVRIKERSQHVEEVAGAYRFDLAFRDLEDRPLKTASYIVTQGFFDVFEEPMALGRGFVPEEHTTGTATTAVLSHRLWRTAYNADPSVVGAQVQASNASVTVVGVASPDFDYPVGASLWVAVDLGQDPGFLLDAVGRLAPNSSIAEARAELDVMAPRFEEEGGGFRGRVIRAQDLKASIVGDTSATLVILLGAAATLLLIACANVMNLLLSRGAGRTREVALRAALGASRWRLIGQLLTESGVLASAGALVGLAAAAALLRVLRLLGPAELPRLAEVAIDGDVLLFAVGATALTGLTFGLLPAVRLVATDIKTLMGGSARGAAGGLGSGKVLNALVLGQTALAVTLVIAAALLVRSFQNLQATDGGFDPEGVVVMDVNVPLELYPDYRDVAVMYEQLVDRVGEHPNVVAVGAASTVPLGEHLDFFLTVTVEGMPPTDEPPRARYRQVTPGFFEAAGIDLVEGRLIDRNDRVDAAGVAVVNRAFVERVLGGGPALGQVLNPLPVFADTARQPLGFQQKAAFEVVGVVDDVRYLNLSVPGEMSVYVPQDQVTFRRMFVTAKVSGDDPAPVITEMRSAFADLDPALPIEFHLMEDVVAASVGTERLSMLLLVAFGLSAAALAAVGLYGVISLGVRSRTPEMAIRTALGAEPGQVLWLSMSDGLAIAGLGLLVGLAGGFIGRSVIASQLYEVSATDPVALIGGGLLLAVVAVIAVLVPALRATRIDLAHTLRSE